MRPFDTFSENISKAYSTHARMNNLCACRCPCFDRKLRGVKRYKNHFIIPFVDEITAKTRARKVVNDSIDT